MNKGSIPEISVVMPVYNAEAHVSDALQSVLDQTHQNFELLVLDDGSTDNTRAVVQQFRDPRIAIAVSPRNLGLVATLNKGLTLSRGDFIARMDADDISEPDRFAKQVRFLKDHPAVDIVGGAIEYFGDAKSPHAVVFPTEHEDIRAALILYCPLAHPTLMFRRCLFDRKLLRYSDEFPHAEDYHLWTELLQHARAANLTDRLLRYRLHSKQVRSEHADSQYEVSKEIRMRLLSRGGVAWTDADIAIHESMIRGRFGVNADYMNRVGAWFDKIEQSNQTSEFWEPRALHHLFSSKFAHVARSIGWGQSVRKLSAPARQYLSDADYRPGRFTTRLFRRTRGLARLVRTR